MARKLRTRQGRAHYARRKVIVEPVFGQTKEARGFDDGHLVGIVTVDDAIDTVIPTAWKKRLPRVFGR